MVCEMPLRNNKLRLTVRGISYWSCSNCDHSNGKVLETNEFCADLYRSSTSNYYGAAYFAERQESYNQRKDDIYLPKANFVDYPRKILTQF